MDLILGAGLTGLSASYHIGHDKCLILEKEAVPFGRVRSEQIGGFTWDQGPHVSFTENAYVRELFEKSVGGEFNEFDALLANYCKGSWIGHPAQSNLYQIPEPLRTQCLASFLEARKNPAEDARTYAEWLDHAFGKVFARNFPAAYTRKYWTVGPESLTTDWIGKRVFAPSVEEMTNALKGPPGRATNYIHKVRYPLKGGYQAFAQGLAKGASIHFNVGVEAIDLIGKKVRCADGKSFAYRRLISTIPLPVFIPLCAQATEEVLDAAARLSCTRALLINYDVPHPSRRKENWIYIYDEDKYATRIHFTENMSASNAPEGRSGIQVEVYESRFKRFGKSFEEIAMKVTDELMEMGLVDKGIDPRSLRPAFKSIDWANVIFDRDTRPSLEIIIDWLARYGLCRRGERDLAPTTDWAAQKAEPRGDVVLAGRYGAWKYYWSDDCVLNGKYL